MGKGVSMERLKEVNMIEIPYVLTWKYNDETGQNHLLIDWLIDW
jgi:hypothetical protein